MAKITISELAKHLGVSSSLVSKALNGYKDVSEEKRKFIINGAKEYGYFPDIDASNLARKNNKKIAIVISANDDDQFIDEISMLYTTYTFRTITKLNYEPMIIFFDLLEKMSSEEIVNYFLSKGIIGVIIFGVSGRNNLELLIENKRIKKVLIDEDFTNKSTSSISTNNKQAQLDILNTFAKPQTIEKILYVSGSLLTSVGQQRNEGYLAFKEANPNKQIDLFAGNFDANSVYHYIKNCNEYYDIVACASDMMAMSAAHAVFKKGQKSLILGFDGINLINYSHLKIATVKQDFKQIAITSVDELIKLIEKNESRHVNIDYKIIENIL